jgi:hypothetical protein
LKNGTLALKELVKQGMMSKSDEEAIQQQNGALMPD